MAHNRRRAGSSPAKEYAMRFVRAVEIVLGVLFVLSAALKAADLVSFAVQVRYYGIVHEPSMLRAIAMGMVGLETALGVAFLAGWRLRGLTFALTGALLLGFTGLIGYAWAFHGLAECGCFGKFIKMTPGASIAKNLVLLALVAPAWWGYRRHRASATAHHRRAVLFKVAAALVCVALVLGAAAYGRVYGPNANIPGPDTTLPVDKDRPFAQFRFEWQGEQWDLGKGEYIVAVLSTSCDHCEEDMQMLNEWALVPEVPPIAALMLGDEEALDTLRIRAEPVFVTRLIDPLVLGEFFDKAPPRVHLVRDGRSVHFWDDTLPDIAEVLKVISSPPGETSSPGKAPQ